MIFGCSIGLHKSLEKMWSMLECIQSAVYMMQEHMYYPYDVAHWCSNVSLSSEPSPLRINLDWVEEDTEP